MFKCERRNGEDPRVEVPQAWLNQLQTYARVPCNA